MIEGVGVEIVEVERFNLAIKRWGAPFYKRLFTEDELGYCLSKRDPGPHLAARFAAKISFFKATGRSLSFQDIGVRRDKKGRPSIEFSLKRDDNLSVSLTITHTSEIAMAVVVAENII
ncbi:MAG: holo-ACP synthase [Thermodesulfobacteriota bacterium]